MRPCFSVLALALACLSGCLDLAEYTIGGASATGGGCPSGQVPCGDACAPAGACDDCPPDQVRCGDACVAAEACDPSTGCPFGQVVCGDGCALADACPCAEGCDAEREVCDGGVCRCRPGLSRCGAACVDRRSDPGHCDGCGQSCAADTVCQEGACVAGCDAPKAACGGGCVDKATDSLHCGDCGESCVADELCLAGECRPYVVIDGCASCPCDEACEAGETDSDGDEQQCCDSPFLGVPVCVDGECP